MCVNCLNSGFHQEDLSDKFKINIGGSREEKNLDSSSLTATSWAQWAPDQVTDGVIDIYLDKTLQGLARDHTIDVIEDIDEIIGTPIRFVKELDADTDIRVGVRDDFEGIIGPGSAGVAHVDENLVSNAYIRTDWVLETDKQISSRKAERRAKRIAKGKDVRPLKQVLQAVSKRILTHEVLHVFGLSHPDDDGYNAAWDTNDSVMSYNTVGSWEYGINFDVSPLDAGALQSIWG